MNFQIQKLFPALCEGCESIELCEKYGVEIKECGQWFCCTDTTECLEDAIELAKSLCSFLDDGNSVRIVCPDGKII